MLAIQVYDADHNYIFTVPMPRLISEYEEKLVNGLEEKVAAAEKEGWFDPDWDEPRETAIIRAELLVASSQLIRDQAWDSDLSAKVRRLIFAEIFSNPEIRKDFFMQACANIIQFALPRDVNSECEMQWVPHNEDIDESLFAMAEQDAELRTGWVAQQKEVNIRLKARLAELEMEIAREKARQKAEQ